MASLSQLFTTTPTQSVPQQQSQHTILEGETYTFYGTRVCGLVTASPQALGAFLPKIYNLEKNRQQNNDELQEELKNQRKRDIDALTHKIEQEKATIEHLANGIAEDKRKIEDAHEKLVDAKSKNGEVNKKTRVKLIIGIVILTILTLYLFIFYSSTFFSAFFRTFDGSVNVGEAMFYANSIYDSYNTGL